MPCSKERTRNDGPAMTTRSSLRRGPHRSYLHALRMTRIERACRYDLPLGHENEETATCLASGNVVTARDRKLWPVKLAERLDPVFLPPTGKQVDVSRISRAAEHCACRQRLWHPKRVQVERKQVLSTPDGGGGSRSPSSVSASETCPQGPSAPATGLPVLTTARRDSFPAPLGA